MVFGMQNLVAALKVNEDDATVSVATLPAAEQAEINKTQGGALDRVGKMIQTVRRTGTPPVPNAEPPPKPKPTHATPSASKMDIFGIGHLLDALRVSIDLSPTDDTSAAYENMQLQNGQPGTNAFRKVEPPPPAVVVASKEQADDDEQRTPCPPSEELAPPEGGGSAVPLSQEAPPSLPPALPSRSSSNLPSAEDALATFKAVLAVSSSTNNGGVVRPTAVKPEMIIQHEEEIIKLEQPSASLVATATTASSNLDPAEDQEPLVQPPAAVTASTSNDGAQNKTQADKLEEELVKPKPLLPTVGKVATKSDVGAAPSSKTSNIGDAAATTSGGLAAEEEEEVVLQDFSSALASAIASVSSSALASVGVRAGVSATASGGSNNNDVVEKPGAPEGAEPGKTDQERSDTDVEKNGTEVTKEEEEKEQEGEKQQKRGVQKKKTEEEDDPELDFNAVNDSRLKEESTLEVDFDVHQTVMFQLLYKRKWREVIERAKNHRSEARTWISRKEVDGKKLRWRVLPIHCSLIYRAPENVVIALLIAYPAGARARDDMGNLPIHLAYKVRSSKSLVHVLLRANPQSKALCRITAKNTGRVTPLEVDTLGYSASFSTVTETVA